MNTRLDPHPWVALACLALVACGSNDGGQDGAVDAAVPVADAASVDALPPVARVRISEVITFPVQDWSDSAGGGGVAYDATVGTGHIGTEDEWIELVNADEVAIDLTRWTLEVRDTVPSQTAFASHDAFAFSPGSSLAAVRAGGYVVVGNPDGVIDTDCYIVLRDEWGRVIDDVEIGGNHGLRDPEHDGSGDGAPDATSNGFARGVFEESVARPDGTKDTDDDQADFVKMAATPLAANVVTVPSEDVAPTVVGSTTGPTVAVSELLRVEFDEPLDPATAPPEVVSLLVGGTAVEVDATTFADADATLVIHTIGRLPFDTDVEVTVRGGVDGVADRAGNHLAADYTFSLHTEAAPANPAPIVINEIVVTPVRDWNDSEGGDGVPFSPAPGDGPATSGDEWIELLNASSSTVDMRHYRLIVFDGFNLFTAARSATRLGAPATTAMVYGTGADVSSVAAGDRVVIGDPVGALFFDCYVELRDPDGVLIDAVEIGGNNRRRDRGGDGVDNGAPEVGADGHSTGIADEAIARVPDGADSGVDTDDFAYARATLGVAND